MLVSSHILSEVQQIADTVTIIGRGRLLAEGNVNQILAADGQLAARVGVSDHLRAAEVLTTSGFTVEPLADRLLKVSLSQPAARSCSHHAAAGRSGPVRLRAHPHPARSRVGVPQSHRR